MSFAEQLGCFSMAVLTTSVQHRLCETAEDSDLPELSSEANDSAPFQLCQQSFRAYKRKDDNSILFFSFSLVSCLLKKEKRF